MRHRVFIAINLPEDIKKELSSFTDKWLELPCRWTKKENIHITLAFLGYLSDEELLETCNIAKAAASKYEPFFIDLKRIIYGPVNKKSPRMVWVEGKENEELGKLQKELENTLSGLSTELKSEKGRGYIPHITLGRLKLWEFQRIDPEERPEINEEINLSFEVNSIDVMESELRRQGPEYTILESAPLADSKNF